MRKCRFDQLALPVLEALERRLLLSGGVTPQWVHLSSASGDLPDERLTGNQQTASLILDVDGDGRKDFVIAERTEAPSVVWFRREAGGWAEYVVDNVRLPIEAGGDFADIDSDGDLDIVFAGDSSSNEIWWWENPYPDYEPESPWTRRAVKSSGADKHHDQIFGDFDGDGQLELATWNQEAGKLLIGEIPEDPHGASSWAFTEVFDAGGSDYEGLAMADVDLDGTQDIVGAGRWYKHLGGTAFSAHVIDVNMNFTRAAAGQLVPGGRPEVLFVPGDADGPLRWYEWDGSAWVSHTLIDIVYHGHSLQVGDVNGDGHADIFVAEMHTPGPGSNCKMRVLYGDSAGNFTEQLIATGVGAHESRLGDLDGDGDLDILAKPYTWDAPRVDAWLNNGTGESNRPPVVSAGADQYITLPRPAELEGQVTDDGLPDPPGEVTIVWSKLSGPGGVVFDDASAPVTAASFDRAGAYVLRLTADDGQAISAEDVTVYVFNAGVRVADDLVVLYDFEEAAGSVVNDTSGVGEPLNLILTDPGSVSWTVGALSIDASTIVISPSPATKIASACTGSNEVTIEGWIRPASATQGGPASIVSFSWVAQERNFTLGQGLSAGQPSDLYNVRLRTTTNGESGTNTTLSSPPGSLATALQHVVFTRDAAGAASIYVDGVQVGSATIGGDLSNWDPNYHLALANELTLEGPWLGQFHLVAIYSRALSPPEVAGNYAAGPDAWPPDENPPKVVETRINGGQIQRSAVWSVSLRFDEQVSASLDVADLSVHNDNTGQTIAPGEMDLAVDPAAMTATWTFPGLPGGALPDGNYTATVSALDIVDAAGNPLDGNGDGVGGDDLLFWFHVLAGDASGDAAVDGADYVIWADHYKRTVQPWADGDFTGNGFVDGGDGTILFDNYGSSLPPVGTSMAAAPNAGMELAGRAAIAVTGGAYDEGARQAAGTGVLSRPGLPDDAFAALEPAPTAATVPAEVPTAAAVATESRPAAVGAPTAAHSVQTATDLAVQLEDELIDVLAWAGLKLLPAG